MPAQPDVGSQPRPLAHLARREDRLGRAAGRLAESFLVRCLLRFVRISGRDRILVLAGQAFTTIIPLFILLAAIGPEDDALSQRLIDRFDLTGSAAAALSTLFSRPPGAASGVTAGGAVLLFFSLLSFAKSLQHTYEAAWDLPSLGLRSTMHGVAGVALMLGEILGLAVVNGLVRRLPGGDAVAFALSAALAGVLWLELQRLLLTRRVDRRRLLPGAVAAGVGQAVVAVYSAIWMPHQISTNAARYGVIGVTFALLTWLIVVAAGVVVAAVVSAEAGRAGGPGRSDPAAAPDV